MKKKSYFDRPNEVIIFDTETTGIRPSDEIIEIAVINLNGDVLYDQRVKPKRESWRSAQRIHGISPEMVANCPSWSQVHEEIANIFSGKYVLGWNVSFDIRMLRYTSDVHMVPWLFGINSQNHSCLMGEYGHWLKKTTGSYKRQKLVNAVEECGLTVNDAHNALGDCLMTLEVARVMAGARRA